MGDLFGSLWDDAKQTVGTGLNDGAHLAGAGLNAAGLTGAARAVDTLGDQAGYRLGADVPELELGETSDPAELVHGDPEAIRSSATTLRTFSGALGETAHGLQGVDTAHWTGAAADAFRARFAPHPAQWQDASSATSTAAGALESYAGAVESAQGQARQAVDLYEQGQQASRQAQATYQAQVAAFNRAAAAYDAKLASGGDPGAAPSEPGAFDDPGVALRQQAAQVLGEARAARDEAASAAAGAIRPASDLAPAEPSFWSQLGDDVMDGLQVAGLAGISFTGGLADGAAGLVKFARDLDPLDRWNAEHPAEYVGGLSSTAAGLAEAGTDPGRLAQGLVGTGWGSDPFQAAGRLVPNLALAAGTDGAGAAAGAGGAAGRVALGSGEDAAAAGADSLAGDPAAAARPPDDIPTAGDPVDVATGDVILAQTDLTLAGALPLVVERMHRSSWRAGRWFGRSWASTFDQRLRIGADRVIGVFGDGRTLIWPRPEVEAEAGVAGDAGVLPVTGAPWVLRAEADGGWTVADRQQGLTWRFEPHPAYFRTASGQGELPLAAIRDRAGHELAFSYDAAGQPARLCHSGGYHVQVIVQDGHVTALAADGQPLAGYRYDEDGNLAGVVDSSGLPLRFSYDGDDRLTGWTDRNGHSYDYYYDDAGRCVRGDGTGRALSGCYRYDPDRKVTTWTDAAGAVTTYEIGEQARVTAITDPLGHQTRWQHDRRGRVVGCTDPLGRTTRYGYDTSGNLSAVTRPDGSQACADYDEQGQAVRITDPAGRDWVQEFDGRGLRTAVTGPDDAVTRFGWDEHGHLASVTDPGGAVTRVDCDAAGLPVRVTGPGGAVTRYERDRLGRVVRVVGPDGSVTELTWTVEGRLASRTLPDGAAEYWDYDPEGNLARYLSPGGSLTRYEYGPFDQPVAMTGPDGVRTELSYDHGLRLTTVHRAGLTWSYGYDQAGRLVAETDWNGATTRYGYDAAGQLTSQVNACGQRVAFRHDQLGNVADRISGGTTTAFGYDLAGRLVYARNADAEVWLDRDPCGRITAETCNGRTVSSAYDAAGRRRRRVTPFGTVAEWEYDEAGQPVRLSTESAGAGEHEVRFGYDEAGREVRRELPGGLVLTQAWDQRGRLAVQALGAGGPEGPAGQRPLQRRAYEYNCDGLVTGIDELLGGARTIGLDRGGRVTAVQGADWAERYAYDPAGNVAAAAWSSGDGLGGPGGPGGGGQGPRAITGTLVTRAGNVRYRHDRSGRVVQRQVGRLSRQPDVWRYRWDASDRLVAVTTPEKVCWRYRYDPFGRRIAKQRLDANGEVVEQTDFTWDGPVLAEQSSSIVAGRGHGRQVVSWDYRPGSFAPLTQSEVCFGDGLVADLARAPQEQIDRRFYAIVTDLVGSPAELAAPDGTLAGHQQQTLWGTTAWRGEASTPLRFPGQYLDPETGLHYNQHRYYDPVAGAYLTPDPLGLAAAPNPHSYVVNPQVVSDPLGLAPYDAAGVSNGGISGSVALDSSTARALASLDRSVANRLISQIAGRPMVMAQTAADEFWDAVDRLAGPTERISAGQLMNQVKVVADDPSLQAAGLRVTKHLDATDIPIFGTADKLGLTIFTSDAKFLRAAAAQNVIFDAIVHRSLSFVGY